jgi:hypothetical protein
MTRRLWFAAGCLASAAVVGAAIAYRAAPWDSGWAGVTAAAFFGAVFPAVVLLGWQAVQGMPRQRLVLMAIGLALAAVAIGGGVAALLMEPVRQQALDGRFRELEQREPVFAALRTADPAAYARFRERLADIMLRGGSSDDAARAVRPAIADAVASRILDSEDELLARLSAVTVRQAEALRPQRPDLCAALLLGRPMGSMAPHVDASLIRAEVALIEELLRAPPPTSPPAFATRAEAEAVLGVVLENAARQSGMTTERLVALADGNGTDAEICAGNIAFLGALQAMPAPLGVPVLRYLMREARRGI